MKKYLFWEHCLFPPPLQIYVGFLQGPHLPHFLKGELQQSVEGLSEWVGENLQAGPSFLQEPLLGKAQAIQELYWSNWVGKTNGWLAARNCFLLEGLSFDAYSCFCGQKQVLEMELLSTTLWRNCFCRRNASFYERVQLPGTYPGYELRTCWSLL